MNNIATATSSEPHSAEQSRGEAHQQVEQLIEIFNITFASTNTRLVRGNGEPIYLPADAICHFNRIEFAHGFYNSALHEIAHWCIAGAQRRKLEDYGYWYCPDGRDAEQQQAFEKVEIKPQAIEWALSVAAGRRFGVSTDNLNGVTPDRKAFAKQVFMQLQTYLDSHFPPRAQQLIEALHQHYGTHQLNLETCLMASKDLSA